MARKTFCKLLILLAAPLLAGCNHSTYQRETELVDSLQRIDSIYLPDSLFAPIVDFYEHHGTHVEQMRAHYLLGRIYHMEGHLQQALGAYQQAILLADTARDYSLLVRAYAQQAEVFNRCCLAQEALNAADHMEHYAWLDGDTLTVLSAASIRARAYYVLGNKEAVLACGEEARRLCANYGYPQYADSYLGIIIPILLEQGRYQEAKPLMDQYEQASGLFDAHGNALTSEAAVFYNNKGSYYLGIHRPDSAEYYFKKQLKEGTDPNNQIGACNSLSLLYAQQGRYEAAYDYARQAYENNDTAYILSVAANLQQMQAAYDYSTHRQVAEQMKLAAQRQQKRVILALSAVAVLILLSLLVMSHIIRRRQLMQQQIDRLTKQALSYEKNEQQQQEQIALLASQLEEADADRTLLTTRYEAQIAQMEYDLQRAKLEREHRSQAEKILFGSAAYLIVIKKLQSDTNLTPQDWIDISHTVDEVYPTFTTTLRNTFNVREDFLKICLLMKMHLSNKDIATLLRKAPQTISTSCTREFEKAFGTNPPFANWRAFINSL